MSKSEETGSQSGNLERLKHCVFVSHSSSGPESSTNEDGMNSRKFDLYKEEIELRPRSKSHRNLSSRNQMKRTISFRRDRQRETSFAHLNSKSMRFLTSNIASSNDRNIVANNFDIRSKRYQSQGRLYARGKSSNRNLSKSLCRSKNFSRMLMIDQASESSVSDAIETNNYFDNNNESDNEATIMLPIEARDLLLQEEEERKSRFEKGTTSILRLTGFGQRKENEFFPKRIRKRVILKNGNINLSSVNVDQRRRRYLQDTFTTMVDIRWRWNLLVFSMGFFISWFGFSIIWWLIAFSHSDFDHLDDQEWTPCVMNLKNFASVFLFSIETQHTIGYGSRFITEQCPDALFVLSLQSITGVMIQCFMVGFVFAKLSRPQRRLQTLIFSRYALINVRDAKLCLMFRVGDVRDRSQIIGAKISALIILKKCTDEGEIIPYYHLPLSVQFDEIKDELFLIWPAIIVHVIDKTSPFYQVSILILILLEL